MEGGERNFQSHSVEYYWLGPDLTQNTQGRYILILPVVVVMLTLPGHKSLYSYFLITTSCVEVVIICICSVIHHVKLPHMIRGM